MPHVKIRSALISVYHKDRLDSLVQLLHQQGVVLYSTGGTLSHIAQLNIPVIPVESLTDYPSIFGGRVKTLHPKIFGGILYRRGLAEDVEQAAKYAIPPFDLVVVDLYPFEQTVAGGGSHEDIIEKIDIGGISLIRAAAKNYNAVVIIAEKSQYGRLEDILRKSGGTTGMDERLSFACEAFDITSHYDSAIFKYFAGKAPFQSLKVSNRIANELRYGENPHQKGVFYGDLNAVFEKLNGKELSYNNLVDADAALALTAEFVEPAFVIIKHTNACGMALGTSVKDAYLKALSCDPVSAFGGVLSTNRKVDRACAEELNKLFFEILLAPDYDEDSINILKEKKNRILLKVKDFKMSKTEFKTLLNGVILQDRDLKTEDESDLKVVTKTKPDREALKALLFANKLVKHAKSNTIVLARDGQLLASGVGQTSRVDALRQAIEKAGNFGFDLKGAVMASDAFFPFPDCVEIAHNAGIAHVVQPGGSIKDQDSIDFCDEHGMGMALTGIRHFKH